MLFRSSIWAFSAILYVCFSPVQSRYFSTSYGQVGITFLSQNKFIGSFVSDSGVEITYQSEWDHNYEFTSVRSSENGNLLSSYYVEYPYRLVRAQSTWILQDLNSGHTVEASFLSHLSEQQLPLVNRQKLFEASRRFFSLAEARSMTSPSTPVMDWNSLINQEDLQLLPSLSFGLVELGYSGSHYPILQRLHRLSAKIYPHLEQSIEPVSSVKTFYWCSSNGECEDSDNSPDEEENCIGLCGPDCKCWCWVCGDCCVHSGCYQHDLCCRENVYSFTCLFPFNFTCDSYSKQC